MADEKADSHSIDGNVLKHLEQMGLSPDQARDAFLDLVEGAKVSAQFNTGKSIDDQEAQKRAARAIDNPQQADPMLRASLVLKQAQAANSQLSLQMQNDLHIASEKFTVTYGSPKDVATAAALSAAGKISSSESGELISNTSRAIGRIKNISLSSIPQTKEGLIYAFQAAKLAAAGAGISPTLSASLGVSQARPSKTQKETDLKLRGLSPSVVQQVGRASSLKDAAIILGKNGVSKEEVNKVANIIRYKTLSRTVSQVGQINPSLLEDVSVNEQKDIIHASLPIEANPGDKVLKVIASSLSNGESWKEFAQEQSLDKDFIASLPSPLTQLSSVEQAENLFELDAAVNQGIIDNPRTLESVVLSGHESSSWQQLQEMKAFFRSRETNSNMLASIDRILPSMPSENSFYSYLGSTREAVDLIERSFWKRAYSVSNKVFGGLGKKGASFLARTPVGGVFQSIGKKTGSWFAGKAVNLGSKGVVALGKKAAAGGAIKGLVGGILGIGTGPAGWAATAGMIGLDLLKGGFKKIGSGINNFITGAFSGSAEDDSDTKIILLVPLAVVILVITITILAVSVIGSSLFVASEGIGELSPEEILNKVAPDQIPDADADSNAQTAKAVYDALIACLPASENGAMATYENLTSASGCLREKVGDYAYDTLVYSALNVSSDPSSVFYHNLQCVGFARAVIPYLASVSVSAAKEYADKLPSTSDMSQLVPGVPIVKTTTTYGHIAIVTNIEHSEAGGEPLVYYVQANGFTGEVFYSKAYPSELSRLGYVVILLD